jgi:hypothetical protein
MEPWKQMLTENPDLAALMSEDVREAATFTLQVSEE